MSTGVGPYLLNRVLTKKALLGCNFKKKKNLVPKHQHYVMEMEFNIYVTVFHIKVTSSENKTKLNILYPKKLYNMYVSKT